MTLPTARDSRARRAFFIGAFLLSWLSLLSFPVPATGLFLDHGWSLATGHFLKAGEQAGVDYVATYGPLGYLAVVLYFPGLFGLKYCWSIAFSLLSAWVVVRIARALPSMWLAVPWLFLCLVSLTGSDARFIVVLVLTALLQLLDAAWTRRRLLSTAGLFALLGLVKFTFLLLGVALLVIVVAAAPRAQRRRVAAHLSAFYAATFLGLWLAAGQAVSHIPRFLRTSLELTLGYSDAMSLSGPESYVVSAAMCAGLLGLSVLVSIPGVNRSRVWFAGVALNAIGLFFSWKEGFVRQDPSHQVAFFSYASLSPFLLLVLDGTTAFAARLAQLAFLAIAAATASGAHRSLREDLTASWTSSIAKRIRENVRTLSSPLEAERRAFAVWEAQHREHSLPAIRARVGTDTIDVASWDQSMVFWNDFNWRHRPIVQGFSAWTPLLARLNGAFLESDRAPRYVLARWMTIDHRFPAEDDGPFLIQLLRHYSPVLEERDFVLFERVSGQGAAAGPPEIVDQREVQFDEEVPLYLDPSELNTVSIRFEKTITGTLRSLFYQGPRPYLLTRQGSGDMKRYELVPDLASEEFLITPLVEGNIDFLWIRDGSPRKLDAIRLLVDDLGRACFRGSAVITIRTYPGTFPVR